MRRPFPVLCFSLSLAFFSQACERNDSTVVDPVGPPPLLIQSSLSPTSVNTDTINIGPERLPGDILPILLHVEARITHPAGQDKLLPPLLSILRNRRDEPLLRARLQDDGAGPDLNRGDSVYTAAVTLQIARSEIGLFYGEVLAEDSRGNRSNAALMPFSIIRLNQAPQLSNLQAPDTVTVTIPGQTAVLLVTSIDPDGRNDILRVQFNSFRPDGSPATGNPFSMFNDGDLDNHGDQNPNDDIYSLKISLPSPPSSPETYRFEFQSFDRSNAGSNTILHFITIRP